LDPLHESNLLGSKPPKITLDHSIKLHKDVGKPHEDVVAYKTLIRKLLYLNTTRPDKHHVCHSIN